MCRVNKGDYTPKRESEVLERFVPRQGDVVVDVDAHIGKYTIISSKAVGYEGRVIAIEADFDNFKMLNYNTKLNRLTNVLALHHAAYSESTKLRLYKIASAEIYNSVMFARVHDKSKYEEVHACTLDDIICTNNIKHVDWLKIDVEGAEFEVLKGARHTLTDNPNLSILLEVHNMDDDPHHYDRILNFLHSFGFSPKFELVYPRRERHAIFHH